jgi:hypothetical protein
MESIKLEIGDVVTWWDGVDYTINDVKLINGISM